RALEQESGGVGVGAGSKRLARGRAEIQVPEIGGGAGSGESDVDIIVGADAGEVSVRRRPGVSAGVDRALAVEGEGGDAGADEERLVLVAGKGVVDSDGGLIGGEKNPPLERLDKTGGTT